MKCQILFSGKNKKHVINLSSAEITQNVVKANQGLGITSCFSRFQFKVESSELAWMFPKPKQFPFMVSRIQVVALGWDLKVKKYVKMTMQEMGALVYFGHICSSVFCLSLKVKKYLQFWTIVYLYQLEKICTKSRLQIRW